MLLLTKGKPTWQLLKYKYKVLINLDPRKEKKRRWYTVCLAIFNSCYHEARI